LRAAAFAIYNPGSNGVRPLTSRSYSFVFPALLGSILSFLVVVAHGQIFDRDLEVQVHNLRSLMARSHQRLEVLLTSLDTVFNDEAICCGPDSALGDSAAAADPKSLQDVAGKLNGRHLFSDGRPFMVKAEYRARDAVNGGDLISTITNQHAALLQWNSHLYVIHGVVYRWYTSGSPETGVSQGTSIHKLLLWDTRYSDARRNVIFDRDTDDWSNVQGALFLQVAAP
jgi:hypothetical protein